MGLALEEPQAHDIKQEIEGIEVFLDKFTSQVESISIDYSTHQYFGGFMVKSGASTSCC